MADRADRYPKSVRSRDLAPEACMYCPGPPWRPGPPSSEKEPFSKWQNFLARRNSPGTIATPTENSRLQHLGGSFLSDDEPFSAWPKADCSGPDFPLAGGVHT